MRNLFAWIVIALCLASLFGGFGGLLWALCFRGPPEAYFLGITGLPAFFLFGSFLPKEAPDAHR